MRRNDRWRFGQTISCWPELCRFVSAEGSLKLGSKKNKQKITQNEVLSSKQYRMTGCEQVSYNSESKSIVAFIVWCAKYAEIGETVLWHTWGQNTTQHNLTKPNLP